MSMQTLLLDVMALFLLFAAKSSKEMVLITPKPTSSMAILSSAFRPERTESSSCLKTTFTFGHEENL